MDLVQDEYHKIRSLWIGVIIQAVDDLCKAPKTKSARIQRHSTVNWFAGRDPELRDDLLFVCGMAGVSAKTISKRAEEILVQKRQQSRTSKMRRGSRSQLFIQH